MIDPRGVAGSPAARMGPVVDVHDLVCHADFRLIRACEGTACTLMLGFR